MAADELLTDRVGTTMVITLNRPERMNALRRPVLSEFGKLLHSTNSDASVKAIVLTGAGRAFCAGTDVGDLATRDHSKENYEPDAETARPWDMTAVGKPTVAAINGAAVGLGVELATRCDIRIGTRLTRCAWAFPHRGLVPDTGAATYYLSHIVGLQTTLRWTMSGRMIEARELMDAGFLAETVAPGELLSRAIAVAEELSTGAPLAIRETKRLIYASFGRDVEEHLSDNRVTQGRMFHTKDHREGVTAFLQKREPRFVGE